MFFELYCFVFFQEIKSSIYKLYIIYKKQINLLLLVQNNGNLLLIIKSFYIKYQSLYYKIFIYKLQKKKKNISQFYFFS